jgi:hypothetical protein
MEFLNDYNDFLRKNIQTNAHAASSITTTTTINTAIGNNRRLKLNSNNHLQIQQNHNINNNHSQSNIHEVPWTYETDRDREIGEGIDKYYNDKTKIRKSRSRMPNNYQE